MALSADGNTALIGGSEDNGSSRRGVGVHALGLDLDPAGQKLTGSGEIGKGGFGESVAMSGEGNTALIGGYDNEDVGAAWVFTRSGSTWTQQGEKLTGEPGGSAQVDFGGGVALSSNGNTALIGGSEGERDHEWEPVTWVFTRSGSTWTQGRKLTGRAASPSARWPSPPTAIRP